MTEINLLPWRDTLRNARKIEFLIVMTIILALVISALIIGVNIVKSKMQRQLKFNAALQTSMGAVETKFSEIKTVKIRLNNLAAKQDALEKLLLERTRAVRLLEQVVYQTPPGVRLTRLDKKGLQLIFEGVAESNVRVSEFMQKIAQSKWITEPHLIEIKVAGDKEDSKEYYFKITAQCL
jgi:type IV pilus assembly protein PilN